MISFLTFWAIVLGVAVALLVVSLVVALGIGGAIRIGDQAGRPHSDQEPRPVHEPNPGLVAVARTDAEIDAIAAGEAAVLQDDPGITRLMTAWLDEVRDDSAWPAATWDAAEVLDGRADDGRDA